MVDEDAAHELRHGGEELRPALPADLPPPHQPQVELVDQGGGLEGVAGPLAHEVGPSQAPQVVHDQRNQSLQGLRVAAAPGVQ